VAGTGKATRFPLQKGDIVQFDKWGAGGYGDPLERDPERVLEDLQEGYISGESAHDVYGVVICDGVVDIPGTEERRKRLAAERVFISLVPEEEDSIDEGTRMWEINPTLAERLHAIEGQVLECIRTGRAPLRGKARINKDLPADQTRIGPMGRKVLGVPKSQKIWLRKVPGALYPEV
jgi:N-methylhydantoinase B